MAEYYSSLAFVTNIGPWQILLIVFVILLLFGAKRLPELFKGLGQGVKEFKKATRDIEEDIRTSFEDNEPKREKKESSNPPPSAKEAENGSHS